MPTTASIFELSITLDGTDPPVWRRIRARSNVTLFKIHGVLQTVMGWTDSHAHQFEVGDRLYRIPDPESSEPHEDEKKTLLNQVLQKQGDRLIYEYDLGDSWKHTVVLEDVLKPESDVEYPIVEAGERACPPEDCGGPDGYTRLIEALSDAGHPDHDEMAEWVGDAYDPEYFDADEINRLFHGDPEQPPTDALREKTQLPSTRQPKLKPAAKTRRN